jgi:hypothetical protein
LDRLGRFLLALGLLLEPLADGIDGIQNGTPNPDVGNHARLGQRPHAPDAQVQRLSQLPHSQSQPITRQTNVRSHKATPFETGEIFRGCPMRPLYPIIPRWKVKMESFQKEKSRNPWRITALGFF